jgi:hypothetical protein
MTATRDDMTYEEALRVIGRHLDAEPAYYVDIRETSGGFDVHYQVAPQRGDVHINHFSWDRLRDLVIFFTSGRGLPRKKGRYQGMWANLPNGHQGFLRAIGHGFDAEGATDVRVQEVDDGVVLSYRRSQADAKAIAETVERSISEAEVLSIVAAAESRRS